MTASVFASENGLKNGHENLTKSHLAQNFWKVQNMQALFGVFGVFLNTLGIQSPSENGNGT